MKKKILLSILCLGALDMSEPVKAGKLTEEINKLNAQLAEKVDQVNKQLDTIKTLSSENATLISQISSCNAKKQAEKEAKEKAAADKAAADKAAAEKADAEKAEPAKPAQDTGLTSKSSTALTAKRR